MVLLASHLGLGRPARGLRCRHGRAGGRCRISTTRCTWRSSSSKLEAIGFGFVVPIFFVVSGINLDVDAFRPHPIALLSIPLFFVLLLLVRGLPILLCYRARTRSSPAPGAGHHVRDRPAADRRRDHHRRLRPLHLDRQRRRARHRRNAFGARLPGVEPAGARPRTSGERHRPAATVRDAMPTKRRPFRRFRLSRYPAARGRRARRNGRPTGDSAEPLQPG